MACQHPEIADPRVAFQRGAERTRRILDKHRVRRVQFGKGLLILAFDHHLRLGRHRRPRKVHQILEPQRPPRAHHHTDPRHRPLRMRCRQLPPRAARVFRQFQRTGAGAGIDEVQMQDFPAQARRLDQFKRQVIVLPPDQPRPQAGQRHRKRQPQLDPRVIRPQIPLVVVEHPFDQLKAEHLVRMGIERAHDAAHVDALLLGLQADRAGHRCLQHHVARVARAVLHRQPEIRDADMLDRHMRAHDQAGRPVLQIGQPRLVGVIGAEFGRIAAAQIGVGRHADQHQRGRRQSGNLGLRRRVRPLPQQRQRRLGLGARRQVIGVDVHGGGPFGSGRRWAVNVTRGYAGRAASDQFQR